MGFDAMLRRYFGVVCLTLLAVAAYFQAVGVAQVIDWSLLPPAAWLAGSSDGGRAPPLPRVESDHATVARAILDRNPFDSTTPRPLDRLPASVDGGSSSDVAKCEGFKALIAVASPNAAWSMAVLSSGSDAGTKLVRVGDVFGGKTVELVEWNRVVLSSTSARCEMVMFRSEKATDRPATLSRPPPGTKAVPVEIASKIERLGPTEFNVERQAISDIIERQGELMKPPFRIAPMLENGRVVGLQLSGIGPETILGVLGFETGDRLQTINGFDMTNAETAMQAYARLRTANHLTVQVNRRGRDTNLDYNVR
jgi:general secretion pathway protein C